MHTSDGVQRSFSPVRNICRQVAGSLRFERSDLAQMAAKIDSLKKWTVSTYKITKQSICENLGKVERTVDKELEEQIEQLKILHKDYNQILAMSKSFTSNFHQMNEAQKGLAESLYQLSLKEISLRTLSEKTFEDTMGTIHNYDQARLEYDVHRNETAALQQSNASPEAVADADFTCNQHRKKYEQLKADVKVKLRLLEENRWKVMRKQLLLLHNALIAYFSGSNIFGPALFAVFLKAHIGTFGEVRGTVVLPRDTGKDIKVARHRIKFKLIDIQVAPLLKIAESSSNAKALLSAMENLNLEEMTNDGVAPSFLEHFWNYRLKHERIV
ncbi:Arfaptin-like domain protein [Onchocerca flexuosa]|uniref:Arfaptin-like domain protein n=1 Tax=Onchocerca flexuosa TaxID=387005 RepID=A0A238BV10_9BILA|nr:Arfaptin-like domain protein [Onchocerca flexuosa]